MITQHSARTYDSAGIRLARSFQTHDGKWADSTGSFLRGELERLDQTLNMPLIEISYTRDIELREDVTIGDEFSSYTLSQIASAGGLGTGNGVGNGKAWIGKNASQITGVSVDLSKIPTPLNLWGVEIKYTIPELQSAIQLGRPIDAQKFEAMEWKHQMDTNEQVYIGDYSLGQYGLVNSPQVTPTNVTPGVVTGISRWLLGKSPDEILQDVDTVLYNGWAQSGWTIVPSRLGLPPAQYAYICTAKVATAAGNMSIRTYIEQNNLAQRNGQQLEIVPMKYLIGAGVGGTIGVENTAHDRMIAYTKNKKYVRFPKTLLSRTPIQYDSIWHKSTYFCRLGAVEFPYPETVVYVDGI